MGQTLSEPITAKHTTTGQDSRLLWSASSMQGWRVTMEDAHTTILNLANNALFCVFDGHGGSNVAIYAGSKLHLRLEQSEAFKQGDYKTAFEETFMGIDIDLKSDPVYVDETSGCTANSVLITQDWRVFCSNAGDSRSVLSCKGTAIPLSFDHKPTNELETKRIIAAGGFVDYGRVNGNLALSRALGDFDFKKNTAINAKEQAVTSFPDIIERQLNTDDEFIILACDGIWDCMSNQDVVDFCLVKISLYDGDLNRVAEDIMDYCLAPDCDLSSVGCDNMTAIVVALLRDKSKEEWVENIKTRTREKGLNPDDFKVLKKQGVMTGNTVYTMPMGTTESPLSESV